MQNIGASNAGDEFYRYKMPPIQSKIEGRGNGIKTNIVNMVDVAKALARPPSYTTKYFGCELGAQSKFDDKTGTAIVNGAHDAPKLAQLLEGFIKRFVQCYACGNPETEVKLAKGETINLQCKACGNVSKVDMRHKLTTFILKNPPGGGAAKSKDDKKMRRAEQERIAEGEAIDRAEKAAKKEARRKEKERLEELEKAKKDKTKTVDLAADVEAEEDDDDDVEWATDTSASAMLARAKEQLTDASRAMVDVDGTKKAAEAQKKEAAERAAKEAAERAAKEAAERAAKQAQAAEEARLAAEQLKLQDQEDAEDDDEEEEDSDSEDEDDFDEQELLEGLTNYASGHTPAQTIAFLSKLPAKDEQHRVKLLVFSILDRSNPLAAQIAKKKPFFAAVCQDGKSQLKLLISFEALLSDGHEKESAHVVKALYDEDLVEEDVILSWYDKPTIGQVLQIEKANAVAIRKKVQPVAEWLRTADEEDDD